MASEKPKIDESPAQPGSLSMQIYAAMLGDEPSFERRAPVDHPRLKMRVRLEAKLEHAGSSPFFRTTWREHVERYAAYAMRALDEARERLSDVSTKHVEQKRVAADPSSSKPIVLIGNASAKRRRSDGSRAA